MATRDGSEDLFDFIYDDLAVDTSKKVTAEPTEGTSGDVQALLARISALQSANEELIKVKEKQSLLLSSLLETSRAEIRRKNLLIADLKRNIEDITFRRACATGSREEFEDIFRKTHQSPHDTEHEKSLPESGSSHLPGLGTFEVTALGERRVQTVVVGNTSFTNIVYGEDLDPRRAIRLEKSDKVENRKRKYEERSPSIAAKKPKTVEVSLENGKKVEKQSSRINKRTDSEMKHREVPERKEREILERKARNGRDHRDSENQEQRERNGKAIFSQSRREHSSRDRDMRRSQDRNHYRSSERARDERKSQDRNHSRSSERDRDERKSQDRSSRTRNQSRSSEIECEDRRKLQSKERYGVEGKKERMKSENTTSSKQNGPGANTNGAPTFSSKEKREFGENSKSSEKKRHSGETGEDVASAFSSVTPDEIDDMNTVDLEALIKRKAEQLARLSQEEEKCKKMINKNQKCNPNKSTKEVSCSEESQISHKVSGLRASRQSSDRLKALFEDSDPERDERRIRSPANVDGRGEVKISPVTRSTSKLRPEVDFTSVAGISSILRDQLVPGSHISPSTGIIQTPVSKTRKEADSAAIESAYDTAKRRSPRKPWPRANGKHDVPQTSGPAQETPSKSRPSSRASSKPKLNLMNALDKSKSDGNSLNKAHQVDVASLGLVLSEDSE